ncbi:aminotransferase class I/II-fold pyridoxal phosphate-dependent enzyme [Dactylosporangium sp. AC04546]|uniref:trans-sulfuration enzyme family protein n=1 Tax=Dactylosporangium sp. AC04546 TaxID=2862460 RepID=UPI001EDDDD2C|nr:aminotransferase class I/II-fold pyridoxal phosphate-dependent enzyme [Dactylosporangium sp. AC04546]WVK78292.1 aminotransferase class I/II-fold pyridoxal phosphate-dependent enzyme [Dactylosporangium sp. AC04546]
MEHPSMTDLLHPAVDNGPGGTPLTLPIYQTSTYELPRSPAAAQIAAAVAPTAFYTRYGSPNAREAETILARLDGAEAALLVGSGMAAVSAALLSNVRAGTRVVAQTSHYTAALTLLRTVLPSLGVDVQLVPQDAVPAAVGPGTDVVYVETPSNPTMALTDLAAVRAAAPDALLIADNTFATPYNTRPLDLGVDLVVQSATKYLNGHSDVTAGVLTGSAQLIARAWETARVLGPVCHPFEAWLLARGLRTFPLRMARHNANGLAVATFLRDHPAVRAVHYPGLAEHPQHDLARRQMAGFGGMLSFTVGTAEAAQRVIAGTKLAHNAVSLGGTETLITHAASLVFTHQTEQERQESGIDPGMLRMSIGLEEPEDIIADLRQALTP